MPRLKTKLRPFQKDGVRLMERRFNGRVLLADEMGLGKTLQCLTYLWRNRGACSPAVVVCPASLKFNWELEARKHLGLKAKVLSGKAPPEGFDPDSLSRCRLIIINYDILAGWLNTLIYLAPQLVIFDECQNIKNVETGRTKYAHALAVDVPNVICVSGTALLNRPIELFSVLNMLRPDEFDSKQAFGFQYCQPRKVFGRWEFKGATRIPELHRRLKKLCMVRRLKADVLDDLPEKVRQVVPVEIPMREYDEARDHFARWCRKNLKLVKANRALRAKAFTQIGYLIRLASKKKARHVVQWIRRFLEESDEKLIVFAFHKGLVKLLMKRFPDAVKVVGGCSAKQRKEAVDAFQNDPNVRIFIGNYKAAGSGLTLTKASTVFFAELPWTPSETMQAEDRIHRIGQTEVARCVYMVAKDTIEERLCELLQRKQSIVKAVLDGEEKGDDLELFDALIKEMLKGKR